jgi:hypothetical protein
MLVDRGGAMIARLGIFNGPILLFGHLGVFLAIAARSEPKPRFKFLSRIAPKAVPVLTVVVAALPVLQALSMPAPLVSPGERAFTVALGIALGLAILLVLWRSLRAPKMTAEEYKEYYKRRLRLPFYGGLVVVVGAMVVGYFWGRSAGLRALDAAAAEARGYVPQRPDIGALEAARDYLALFDKLDGDRELADLQARVFGETPPAWPAEDELAGILAARRGQLDELLKLTAGTIPEFALEPWRSQADFRIMIGLPGRSRPARFLLEMAARGAAIKGDGARAVECLRAVARLGDHVGTTQRTYGLSARCRPRDMAGFALILPSLGVAARGDLAAYQAEMDARRKSLPELVARERLKETASNLLWMHQLIRGVGNPQRVVVLNYTPKEAVLAGRWFVVPLYGAEGFSAALPRAREESDSLLLPQGKALEAVSALTPRDLGVRMAMALACFPFPEAGTGLELRANAEQDSGALETACALTLHRLDNGGYPESLAALAPKYLDASVLDSAGPVRLTYARTASGCRLSWRAWGMHCRSTWRDGKRVETERLEMKTDGEESSILLEERR